MNRPVLLLLALISGCAAPAPPVDPPEWRKLADQFNTELAGRFPFGRMDSPDASPRAVASFFATFRAMREMPQTPASRAFKENMDAVVAFLRKSRFAVTFRQGKNCDQILEWRLNMARYPNGPRTLDWSSGQPVLLEMTWSDRSEWRPAASTDRTAVVSETGAWGLLRLIENCREKGIEIPIISDRRTDVAIVGVEITPAPPRFPTNAPVTW